MDETWEEIAARIIICSLPASDIEIKIGSDSGWTKKSIALRKRIIIALKEAYCKGIHESLSGNAKEKHRL